MTTNALQSKFEFSPTLEPRSGPLSSEYKTFVHKKRSCGRAWSALGAYLSEILDDSVYPKITHEEALSLGGAAFAGDRAAVDVLVTSHLRLVVKIAREYESFGVQTSDLVAEGNLGLLRAAELYNPKFGTRFLNYAALWIRQRMQRAIAAQTRAVRIPLWRSQRLRKLARSQQELTAQLGRAVSEDEVAENLGMQVEELLDLQNDRIEVVSMDANFGESGGEGRSLSDMLPDEAAPHPAERLGNAELREEILACLADLNDRELQVLSMKFGLSSASATSFRELGRKLGVSHEWVRRIAELALVKVRRAFSESSRWTVSERIQRMQSAQARVCSVGSLGWGSA